MDWVRCVNDLRSQRSTHRIRGLKLLSTLLDSQDALDNLASAERDSEVCLGDVFIIIHRLLVKEALKVHFKRGRMRRPSTASAGMESELKKIFSKVIAKMGEDKHRIPAAHMVTSINQIFSSDYLITNLGASYYVNIVTTLLKRRSYWGEITGKGWRDLIRISVRAYKERVFGLDKAKVAKSMARIIALGCLHTDLSLWIASRYTFMLEVVKETDYEVTYNAESSMMLALSFATKVAMENRELACQFGEQVLDFVLKCYDTSVSEIVVLKSLVLEFLIFEIKIHHPDGAIKGSMSVYADDWQMWESQMKEMFQLLEIEISTASTSGGSRKLLNGRLLEFAVEITHQIMSITQPSLNDQDEDDMVFRTTDSLATGFQVVLQVLKDLPENSAWLWLHIISILIRKYSCVNDCTYISFLDYLSDFTVTSRSGVTMESFFRAIGLNQCESSAHETICVILASNLISSKKHLAELFNLYLNDRIRPSEGSVRTLHCLMMSFDIVDGMELPTRQTCLNWIYPAKDKLKAPHDVLPVGLIADVIVQLCLKSGMRKAPTKRTESKCGPLEYFYSQLLFSNGLLIPCTDPSSEVGFMSQDELSMDETSFNIVKDVVSQDSESLISWVNGLLVLDVVPEEGVTAADFLSTQLQVVVLVASNLIEWGLFAYATPEIESFLHAFKMMLMSLADLLEVLLKNQQSSQEFIKTFSNLAFLYELKVDEQIALFMRENTPRKLINMMLCEIKDRAEALKDSTPHYTRSSVEKYVTGTTINYIDYYSILDHHIYSESTHVIALGCKILGGYCCKYGGNPYLQQQQEVLSYFLKYLPNETTEIGFPLRLQMLMVFLYVIINRMALSNEYLATSLKKFKRMLSEHSNDVELLQIFLTVLEEVSMKVLTNSSLQDVIVKGSKYYLERLYRGVVERKLPPTITVKTVRFLGSLMRMNPDLTWPWLLDGHGKQISISNFLSMQLDSPYSEVRMVVAEHLHYVLRPLRYTCAAENSSLLMWMKYITNSCSEESSISADEHRERNNVQIALHCLCVVTVMTSMLRKPSLYYILKLITYHNLRQDLGKKIISILGEKLECNSKELVCGYLFDYLEKWIMLNEFKEFPHWIMYNCVDDFYLENTGTILSALWMANHESLDYFCQTMGKNAAEMLEDHSAFVIAITLSKCLNLEDREGFESGMITAQRISSQLIKVSPGQILYGILSKKKNSILYNIFKILHDEAKIAAVTEERILSDCKHKLCYPVRGNYFFTKEMLAGSFEKLCFWSKEPNGVLYMDYVINESPCHLRSVMLMLACDMINAPTSSDALSALVSFQSYVEFVMEYVTENLSNPNVTSFMRKLCSGLIRDASFSFMRLIRRWSKAENDSVYTIGFIYFYRDLNAYFIPLMGGLQVLLVPLGYALADLVKDGLVKPFEKEVLKLIKTLLEMESLKNDLIYLVTFPRIPTFQPLNDLVERARGCTSLRMDMQDFLEAYNLYGIMRAEMLQYLKTMLKEKNSELHDLYSEVEEMRDSFKKYSEGVLHKVICLLSKLCTTTDHEIKIEAAKCLAELGAGDMQVAILVHETAVSNTDPSTDIKIIQMHRLTFRCLELLPKYLLDSNMEVVEATSTALTAIINSKEGECTLRAEQPCQLRLAEDYSIITKEFDLNLSLSPLEFNEAAFSETYDLWIPTEDGSYSEWITSLVTSLLRCFPSLAVYMEKLIPICRVKVPFCEEIFPFVMEIFILSGDSSCHAILFEQLHHFFRRCYETYSSNTDHMLKQRGEKIKNKKSIVTMLNAVNYLSLQHYETEMKISGEFQTNAIDYLHCAVAAQHCSAYFSAIQYCELWLSHVSKGSNPNKLSYHVQVNTPQVTEIVQVLRESYAGLGNTDGLRGCGTSHLLEPLGRIEHFKDVDKWEQVMRSYELELYGSGKKRAIDGLLMSMQMQGMEEILMGLLETREQEEMASCKYECAWRLGSWNLLSQFTEERKPSALFLTDFKSKSEVITQIDEEKINTGYHRNLFLALRSLHKEKFTESVNHLNQAREFAIESVSFTSLEATQNIFKPISWLNSLKEVEEFSSLFKTSREDALKTILSQWKNTDFIGQKSFKTVEPIKALRLTLLKNFCNDNKMRVTSVSITDESTKAMTEIQLQLGRSAREVGMYAMSEKYLRAVRSIVRLSENPLIAKCLASEEAQLFWAKGDADIAKIIMEPLINISESSIKDQPTAECHAEALTVYGHWVMHTHSERAKEAISKYFEQATDILNAQQVDKNSKIYLNAVRAMAVYADEQYVLVTKYIDSSSFAKKQQYASLSMDIVTDYQGACHVTADEKRSIMLLEKQAKLDEKELEECEANKISYLSVALNHYVKYLKFSSEISLDIAFRFVSLFMENHSEVESIFKEVESIPAYKFVPVIPQLLPRIVLSKGRCSRTLKQIVEKCASQHPHHVLPPILALAYSLKDLEKAKGSDAFITETQKANQQATQKMVAKLRKREGICEHVKQLSTLWEALISLAYLEVENPKRHNHTLGPDVPLMKITDLTHVQIPTVRLPESATGEYRNIVSVWKYVPEFTLVGGINLPKKIICLGSDGKKYPQLLKGRDDLRQDAVMQQVFHLMNSLLYQDEVSRKRRLRMRTYRVVPLSHRSGIIEWCTNTTSIGNYLGGRNGAHAKYHPSDYPVRMCRHMLQDTQKSSKNIKLQVYLEICANLQPVFRHYFLSKFKNPAIWYEMRQAYTRSVATSSIIGYVLGLGDRHLQNILIDEDTAEVLHVDLGIAFEQGKTLGTPETVPFRLTRDIVDGMGIAGVEGLFRRSCEITMEVMRKYRKIILTVLEVLIYDPLYAWTLKAKYKLLEAKMEAGLMSSNTSTTTPSVDEEAAAGQVASTPASGALSELAQAKRGTTKGGARASTSGAPSSTSKSGTRTSTSTSGQTSYATTEAGTQSAERNKIAMRALERLEQKLMGTEDGTHPSSIEAQVEKLIQEAQDPENLCELYPGWQPYL